MDITSYLLGKKASGGGGRDWTAIGYSGEPETISQGYNYAKQVYDNWDSSKTSYRLQFNGNYQLIFLPLVDISNATRIDSMCYYCLALQYVPQLNTSNVQNFSAAFQGCSALKYIPQLNTSVATNCDDMFSECKALTDESLDNILKMCININPSYSRTKTLYKLGFRSATYPATRIQALPSYQDFIDAGWTIGY